ncbi:hypothetical protein GN958_ATG04257 [Phytophthora infestans]|uniref:Uncharacterized protein n=1 Tax=Phytophthora infestans TaxID=4787 RepID=A0A8S9V161_PHYIN|nr:hypothetical protein GN958_ATG04257 [Phytophthora infestans]
MEVAQNKESSPDRGPSGRELECVWGGAKRKQELLEKLLTPWRQHQHRRCRTICQKIVLTTLQLLQ